jgi:hypothetical protein
LEWTLDKGEWQPLYARVARDDQAAVEAEIQGQLASFRELVGRDPTHIDGHQHIHRKEPAKSILLGLAEDLGVPLRDFSGEIQYVGSFYGQDLDGAPLGRLTFDDVYRTSQIGDARGDLLVIEATFTNESDESLRLKDLVDVGNDLQPCTTGVCRSGDFEMRDFSYYNGGGWISPTTGGSYSRDEDRILGGDTMSFSYFLNMNPGSIRPNPEVASSADLWLVPTYSGAPPFPRSAAVRLSAVLGTADLPIR